MLLKLDGSLNGIKMVNVLPDGRILTTDKESHFFEGKYLTNHKNAFPGRKALCAAVPYAEGFCFGVINDVYRNGRWIADI